MLTILSVRTSGYLCLHKVSDVETPPVETSYSVSSSCFCSITLQHTPDVVWLWNDILLEMLEVRAKIYH